ncbi:L-lactate dehydrogenase (cytochrome) [Rhizobium sp. CF080]|uniref:alpha-hydroxy acid oxidase n=1 Tax=Rhizobium sp. (strain CF080) TaxID=1144310 RepID=UPI000271B455|nr:alpha-hydroxy acid oxidase [Rhizobium sp. CF080]EUB99864.1 L-lactate dehydrogenase (cytochrome) [Rhizobium sp. CF080]
MAIDALNFHELRQLAKARLPRGIFEYIDRGSEDERGLQHLRNLFDEHRIAPHVLTGGETRSLAVELFGERYASPLIAAPTAFTGLVWHKGEVALAHAAAAAGIPYCAATEAVTSIEEIAAASSRPVWFQLYLWEDKRLWKRLLETAWACGVRTLVLTVDTPVFAKREFNLRNGFGIPFRFSAKNMLDVVTHPRWAFQVLGRYAISGALPDFANYPPEYRHNILGRGPKARMRHMPGLSWDHIGDVRREWKGNLLLKGILRPDDAVKAASAGMNGIVVSSHGARNLDSAAAPIEVLQRITETAGNHLTILADSGIQRGSDIYKLLASGAKAVMVGRAFLYGTAVAGQAGAEHSINMLTGELDTTMALAGCSSVCSINPD